MLYKNIMKTSVRPDKKSEMGQFLMDSASIRGFREVSVIGVFTPDPDHTCYVSSYSHLGSKCSSALSGPYAEMPWK